jgi:hypothetical protein
MLLFLSKSFCLAKTVSARKAGILMRQEEAIQVTKALTELSESYKDLYRGIKGTSHEVAATKKLWREGNKSKLIKIGVACIMFPDPSPVGEIIGAGFIAAGLVQKGIQKQSIYLGDIKKTFESTLRDVHSTRQSMR